MAPAFTTVIIYPRSSDTTFNLQYYLNKHIPLAKELWGKYGMEVQSISEVDDSYHLATVLGWESREAYERALQDPGSKDVMRDVNDGNFTNAPCVFLTGNRVG